MVRLDYHLTAEQHRDVVLGRQDLIPRGVAIALLPGSEVDEPEQLLREIALDRGEDDSLRVLAANTLWRTDTRNARQILGELCDQLEDGPILTVAVKTLGRVGDEMSLATVERIQRRAQGVLADQASFAASLIAYRLGLPDHALPAPERFEDLPAMPVVALDFAVPSDEERDLFQATLASEPYGIRIAVESIHQFQCPGGGWMLGFNADLLTNALLETLLHRKTLFGLLTSKNSEDGRYSVSYLLFTSPEPGRQMVRLQLHRVTGQMAWGGTARVDEDGRASFRLRAVHGVGIVPIELEGILLADGRIEFGRAVTTGRVLHQRHLERLEVPQGFGGEEAPPFDMPT